MNDLAVERVKKGAAWLDKEQPGWTEQIDLGKLDMASCKRCMLGQLFEDFGIGQKHLPHESLESRLLVASAFGFLLLMDEWDYNYRDLEEAWVAEIKARYDAGFAL